MLKNTKSNKTELHVNDPQRGDPCSLLTHYRKLLPSKNDNSGEIIVTKISKI